MQYTAETIEDYILQIPEERREAFSRLRNIIKTTLHRGFEEGIIYKMPGWYVPHSLYPPGYHCNPEIPLPFINLASQKHFIALYHSGIYADKKLLDWFIAEFPKYYTKKLDMGKSCIRFKNIDEIPFELIRDLCAKMTVNQWIKLYEARIGS